MNRPDKEGHRMSSGRALSAGASVPSQHVDAFTDLEAL